jgi:hypothetical protein
VWIGCSLLIGFIAIRNLTSPNLVLNSPLPQAAKMIEKIGSDDAKLLLRHLAAEQVRSYVNLWEYAEIGMGVLLLALLYTTSQSRFLPLIFAGGMLVLVLFQHVWVLPELTYLSREADFPPGNATFAVQARVWTLGELYAGAEAMKLLIAGVLTSYLFVFYASSGGGKRKLSSSWAVLDDAPHPQRFINDRE